jgi:hypothetical protein
MTKEEQLRYLEQIYGDIEDGNCDLSEAVLHQDISGSKEIRLSVVYSRSAQVSQAAGHNHGPSKPTKPGVYISSDPAVYTSTGIYNTNAYWTSITGVTS